ncbi:unnamed protein product [Musa textilis]
MGGDDPCVVPVSRRGTKDPQQLSALQLKKGVRKGELTFVAAIKLEPLDGEAIKKPTEVANVLKEFTDVMPPELSKTLAITQRRGSSY